MMHEIASKDHVVFLRIRDELGSQNAAPFRDATEKVSQMGCERVVVDLAGISFMSSMAISALFSLYRKLHDGGGELVLLGVGRELAKVLDLVGLPALVKIFDRQKDALQHLSEGTG